LAQAVCRRDDAGETRPQEARMRRDRLGRQAEHLGHRAQRRFEVGQIVVPERIGLLEAGEDQGQGRRVRRGKGVALRRW
jgi:hypothetical protein